MNSAAIREGLPPPVGDASRACPAMSPQDIGEEPATPDIDDGCNGSRHGGGSEDSGGEVLDRLAGIMQALNALDGRLHRLEIRDDLLVSLHERLAEYEEDHWTRQFVEPLTRKLAPICRRLSDQMILMRSTAKKLGSDSKARELCEWAHQALRATRIELITVLADAGVDLFTSEAAKFDRSCQHPAKRIPAPSPSHDGNRRSRAETCNNVLRAFGRIQRQAAKRLSVDDWEIGTVHDLRRTFCTMMADVVPMHALQAWAGHSDIAVTARFYLEVSDSHADQARAALALS